MSRRKDRERVETMRRRYPAYPGFRGPEREPDSRGYMPLQSVRCCRCRRKRNVPVEVAEKEGAAYVCIACKGGTDG